MEEVCRWITLLIILPLLFLLGASAAEEAPHRSREDAGSGGDLAHACGTRRRPSQPVPWFVAGGGRRPTARRTTAQGTRAAFYHRTPHFVVAKDGTGNYTTVADAVSAAPSGSARRFVILIKAGVYHENVVVPAEKTNITFVGARRKRTVLTSDRSQSGGWQILHSATLAVVGDGFVASHLTIENSAGPLGGQAVAVMSSSDQSAFYRCNIIGYQDTLYARLGRQFFRECRIYGTIDFIFGDAAAVLQRCSILARRPLPGQGITFTAQGRESSTSPTGTVIDDCVLDADDELRPVEESFQAFLGRPWQLYSTVIVMQSQLGRIIDPAGWTAWDGSAGLDTLTYMEYDNRGPGSDVSQRVSWPGFRVLSSPSQVQQFTVSRFIQGDTWLPSAGIPYHGGLL